jgi:hypothetical protein
MYVTRRLHIAAFQLAFCTKFNAFLSSYLLEQVESEAAATTLWADEVVEYLRRDGLTECLAYMEVSAENAPS